MLSDNQEVQGTLSEHGPLAGVRVVELGGIGPAPFTGMLFADLGAEVLRVARDESTNDGRSDPLHRGKHALVADLRAEEGRDLVLAALARADMCLEGFRPGAAERLGVGPEEAHVRNSRLVYGRVTGWGQTGPLRDAAGHDINYIAIAGVLDAVGMAGGPPVVPLNLFADFGGGGMLLAVGMLAAYVHAQRTGAGQVVDAAMAEGANLLATMIHGFVADGQWGPDRGSNLLDGGAPFYGVYACQDGRYIAVGAVERQFYERLCDGLGLDAEVRRSRMDRNRWPVLRSAIAAAFASRTRDDWVGVFDDLDACVTPVLDLEEATGHPHNLARKAFEVHDGVRQPAPAPRFTVTPPAIRWGARTPDGETDALLRSWGVLD